MPTFPSQTTQQVISKKGTSMVVEWVHEKKKKKNKN
jgi:hypothetical protein